jgi:glycosyltransferase involved in cell wall biosynthesis
MTSASAPSPRVSLLLLAYNQESMVRRAAESCLAQDCEPLEIVLSDDASTDRTFEILQELARNYRGPHRVSARRSARNVGIGEHYNQLLAASSGQLLVTAAGDDFSEPHRVRRLIEAWDATGGTADLIASHVIDLDHDGVLHEVIRVDDLAPYRDVHQWMAQRPYIIGAGHAFTRRIMERFGPMGPEVFYEDQIMVFRAIVSGGAITVDEPLVHYRRGGTSRRPRFESAEHMVWWNDRQRGRELAEMDQLIKDATLAGCDAPVRAVMEKPLRRDRYLRKLRKASTQAERWAALREAAPLPLGWRLKKMLHVVFPHATLVVKRKLSVFHRRQH